MDAYDEAAKVKFTVSVGVAEIGEDMTQEQLVARADEALYRAKREGRDCYRAAR